MANPNNETDNLDYLEDDDAAKDKRSRQEAIVTQRLLSYLQKHTGWHLLRDVCDKTKMFEKYGTAMCLEVTQSLINVGELDEELRDSKRYIRFNEEQS